MRNSTLTTVHDLIVGDLDTDTTVTATYRRHTRTNPPALDLTAHGLTFQIVHTGNYPDGRPLVAWDLLDGGERPVVGSQATVLTGSVAADVATLINCARLDFWPTDLQDDALETINVTPGHVARWIGAR